MQNPVWENVKGVLVTPSGISHVLFGHEIGNSDYAKELHKALWFKEGNALPNVRGAGALSGQNDILKEHLGIDYGITISVISCSGGVSVNLNLNRKMNWSVICAKSKDLTSEQIEKLGEGICIILFKSLNKGLRLTLPELLAHNLGNIYHPDLAAIEQLANINCDYFKNL